MGTADWAQAQAGERGRLLVELVTEIRHSQEATHQLDDLAARSMGINMTDGRCIDLIDLHGRVTAGELARLAGLTTGAVTAVLDRLEKKGFVRRSHDAADRRRIQVEVTDKAREESLRIYGPLKDRASGFFDGLSDDELRLLVEFTRIGREMNQTRAAEVRAELDGSGG